MIRKFQRHLCGTGPARLAASLLAAGLALPLLAGCGGGEGGGDEAAAPAGAKAAVGDQAADKQKQSLDMRRREEDMIAACMRRSGFTYQPHVPPEIKNPTPIPVEYEEMKTYRTKYGFGHMFAAIVYKGDPNVTPYFAEDPNDAIRERLDPGQRTAYDRARYGPPAPAGTKRIAPSEGCVGEAVKAVDPAAREEREDTGREIAANGGRTDCDADCQKYNNALARLKPQEVKFVNCLKAKGYTSADAPAGGGASVAVTDIADRFVGKRFDRVNKATFGNPPDVDPDVARAELRNEIKVALEELECGKEYLPAVGKAFTDYADGPPTGGLA